MQVVSRWHIWRRWREAVAIGVEGTGGSASKLRDARKAKENGGLDAHT